MSMQLRFTHTTEFEYDGTAATSFNEARLTPQNTAEQIVVHSRVEVSPSPWIFEYRDYFGTQVVAFEVLDPHDAMAVRASATVQVNRAPSPPASLTWAQIAEREVADRWTEYLTLPEIVAPTDDFRDRVQKLAANAEKPGDAALAICCLIHDEVEYVPGSTDVASPAAQAWRQRSGVCQDMVHLALGGLRAVGVPARYVSGYYHPQAEPVVGETVSGESHAWVEWWDEGWRAFDPTSGAGLDDRYVVVATGRDYRDVKPLAGIYSGGATTEMSVSVQVTRIA